MSIRSTLFKARNINELEAQLRCEPREHFQLCLAFSSALGLRALAPSLSSILPNSIICGCTTAGQILSNKSLEEEELIVALLHFEHTQMDIAVLPLESVERSFEVGTKLAQKFLSRTKLKHIFVISEGIHVNGSKLVEGFQSVLPTSVTLSGGLAADGTRFGNTLLLAGNKLYEKSVLALAFFGDKLSVGLGSMGGCDPFGPERTITRSSNNIVYELDQKPALALYREYLGEYASELPASGLLFPLSIQLPQSESFPVRTLLGIDEKEGALIFAGDMPQGAQARLNRANPERLLDGAQDAAHNALLALSDKPAEFGILISCVGRKLVLKQRVEEEIEAVCDVLEKKTPTIGFYSYGEIAPFYSLSSCVLHNHTMTVTALRELA